MADDGSDFWPFEDFSAGDDDNDPMEVDFRSLWKILGDNPDPAQVGCDPFFLLKIELGYYLFFLKIETLGVIIGR